MAEEDIYFAKRDRELIEALRERKRNQAAIQESGDKKATAMIK